MGSSFVTTGASSLNMSTYSYTEFGIQIKHVRYAVRIPELPTIKLRKSKTLRMKRPRIMKGRRRSRANTGTLDSLDVDWKKEFDQKYADLIFKTEAKKKASLLTNSIEDRLNPETQEDINNLSFSSGKTYTISCSNEEISTIKKEKESDNDELLFLPNLALMKEEQDSFGAKKEKYQSPYKARKLSYSYHILQTSHS